MAALSMRAEERGGWLVVVVGGRVDATNAPEFEAFVSETLASGPEKAALDLSLLDHLSSPALRVLLTTLKAVERRGGALELVAPKPHVRRVLAVSGLERLFAIRDALP